VKAAESDRYGRIGDRQVGMRIRRGGNSQLRSTKEMTRSTNALRALWKEEEGLTVVEYAIAGGLIGAVVIAAFVLLGSAVANVIQFINDTLRANSPAANG
jgi:pilus assembly protein Flp/PilA